MRVTEGILQQNKDYLTIIAKHMINVTEPKEKAVYDVFLKNSAFFEKFAGKHEIWYPTGGDDENQICFWGHVSFSVDGISGSKLAILIGTEPIIYLSDYLNFKEKYPSKLEYDELVKEGLDIDYSEFSKPYGLIERRKIALTCSGLYVQNESDGEFSEILEPWENFSRVELEGGYYRFYSKAADNKRKELFKFEPQEFVSGANKTNSKQWLNLFSEIIKAAQ